MGGDSVPPRRPRSPAGDGRRRIHVAFFIDGMHIGGTELNAVRTAERLDRERFELSVFCHVPEGPLRERYDAAGIPVYPMPIRGMFRPGTLLQAWRTSRQLRELGVDIVHAHDLYTNVFGTMAARLAGSPALITSRRWWDAVPRRIYRVANRLAYRSSSRVLANSPAVGRLLVSMDGVPEERVVVIPNFLEEDTFIAPSPSERSAWRATHGIPPEALVVGCVANLRPVKDHPTLIRAFSSTLDRVPDARLVLAGDGPSRQQLEDLVSELNITNRTVFVGRIPNRPNIHHHFDVSVLTSIHEGSPNSLIEAMAAGRPVIATATGGVVDVVRDGATGLLAPSGDHEAVATNLGRLLTNRDERTAMGARAVVIARERYIEAHVLGQLGALYRSLVPAGRVARASL